MASPCSVLAHRLLATDMKPGIGAQAVNADLEVSGIYVA